MTSCSWSRRFAFSSTIVEKISIACLKFAILLSKKWVRSKTSLAGSKVKKKRFEESKKIDHVFYSKFWKNLTCPVAMLLEELSDKKKIVKDMTKKCNHKTIALTSKLFINVRHKFLLNIISVSRDSNTSQGNLPGRYCKNVSFTFPCLLIKPKMKSTKTLNVCKISWTATLMGANFLFFRVFLLIFRYRN